jgi:hypothetical protein
MRYRVAMGCVSLLLISSLPAMGQERGQAVPNSTNSQDQTEAPAPPVKQKIAKSIDSADRTATSPAGGTVVTPGSTAKGTETSGELNEQSQAPASANDAAELAKKLSNPVASLISLPLQSNFDFRMGTGSGWRYTLNVQPVIPIALSSEWNMISRTIIPFIHQSNVTGPGVTQNGVGDITQSLFFSPNKSEPFVWAVGPVVLLHRDKFKVGIAEVRHWTDCSGVEAIAWLDLPDSDEPHLVGSRELESRQGKRHLPSACHLVQHQRRVDLWHQHGIFI